jgi:hypothetical protein
MEKSTEFYTRYLKVFYYLLLDSMRRCFEQAQESSNDVQHIFFSVETFSIPSTTQYFHYLPNAVQKSIKLIVWRGY